MDSCAQSTIHLTIHVLLALPRPPLDSFFYSDFAVEIMPGCRLLFNPTLAAAMVWCVLCYRPCRTLAQVYGYCMFKDGEEARLGYPTEGFEGDVAGRSFHNGRFVQRLRQAAASVPSITIRQGIAKRLLNGLTFHTFFHVWRSGTAWLLGSGGQLFCMTVGCQ
jgi:hypothetical protein